MEYLIDPNIAYVLIVSAAMLALVTVLIPGSGLPETGLLICLGLSWYEISHLAPNLWALLFVALSLVPFFMALRSSRLRLPLLASSILLLSGGSIFLFVDQKGWPTVNPILAGIISSLCAGFIWIAVERSLKIQGAKPEHDPDLLIGKTGQARTEIFTNGSVQAGGELWSARSALPIPAGSQVRVLKRDGFVLLVEIASK